MTTTCTVQLLALFLFASATTVAPAVYVFQGDPYQPGPLKTSSFTLEKGDGGIPEHTLVTYPGVPGVYVPLVFVPGLNGIVYAEFYTDVLNYIASHGYIVVSFDLGWPGVASARRASFGGQNASAGEEPELLFEALHWLVTNLNQVVLPTHDATNVTADWSLLGAFSHSSGADDIIRMLQNTSFAKAVTFLEPFSYHFTEPLPYTVPALSFGTQLCTEEPACCINGWDYFNFYAKLTCPRILMNVTGFGHCDILNEFPGWDSCNLIHFCKTEPTNDRSLYRLFVQGVVTAFMGVYLQGNSDLLKFITTQTVMPLPLGLLEYDLNC